MNKPLITIAMAVYNVEKYLRDALDDIVNQTYTDLEIICIDDASTDSTWSILEEFAARDCRIRLMKHIQNMGLSVSRNESIDNAKGEYLLMLDGDDRFSRSMVENALNHARRTDADVVIWDYTSFEKDSELSNCLNLNSKLNQEVVKDKLQLLRLPGFIWLRLFRTDFLRRMNIRFEVGLTKQDIPIHWRIATEVENIAILPKKQVFYRVNQQATSARRDRSILSLARVMDIVCENLRNKELYDTYRMEYLRRKLSLLHGMYDFIKPEFKAEALDMVRKRIDADALEYLKCRSNALSLRTKLFYRMLQGDWVAKLEYNLFLTVRGLYRKMKR